MSKYIRKTDNQSFIFIIEGINEILPTDIPITEEEYQNFFEEQCKGKTFKLKEKSTGEKLFDLIEEYIQESIQAPLTEEQIKIKEQETKISELEDTIKNLSAVIEKIKDFIPNLNI